MVVCCSSTPTSFINSRFSRAATTQDTEDLDQTKARVVTIASFSLSAFTILTCYTIAVSLGHVPAWLPMISDCAVYPPEKYIFRIGMILSAALLELNCLLMYFFLHSVSIAGGVGVSDKLGMAVASVASFSLACVGAINEQEDDPVHSAFAVIFFFGFEFYMAILTYKLYTCETPLRQIQPASLLVKTICTGIAGVALALFLYFSQNWGRWHIEIAVCEWTGTFAILVFNLSFCYEYGKDLMVATLLRGQRNNEVLMRPLSTLSASSSESESGEV